MRELSPAEFSAAAPLFVGMQDHLCVPAALTGESPARLYVDEAAHPRRALLWVQHRLFLAGPPGGDLAGLEQVLRDQVFAAHPRDFFVFMYTHPEWGGALGRDLLQDNAPIAGPRAYYEYALPAAPLTVPPAPDGFLLRSVDAGLLADDSMTNLDDLREEMLSERATLDDFLARSFGVVITSAQRVITWCLSEYNLGPRCEVGIACAEDHKRRGLATLTGQAFLAEAQRRGITRVGWHCWQGNLPSVQSALKLGFNHVLDYPAAFVCADPAVTRNIRKG